MGKAPLGHCYNRQNGFTIYKTCFTDILLIFFILKICFFFSFLKPVNIWKLFYFIKVQNNFIKNI